MERPFRLLPSSINQSQANQNQIKQQNQLKYVNANSFVCIQQGRGNGFIWLLLFTPLLYLTHLGVITANTVMRIYSLCSQQTIPWLLIHAMKDVIWPNVSQHRWAHQRWRGSHRGKGPGRWEVWDSMPPSEWSVVMFKHTHECKNLLWTVERVFVGHVMLYHRVHNISSTVWTATQKIGIGGEKKENPF